MVSLYVAVAYGVSWLTALSSVGQEMWSRIALFFFFSSRRRHTRLQGDWSSDVCSSDLKFGGRGNKTITENIFFNSADYFLDTTENLSEPHRQLCAPWPCCED